MSRSIKASSLIRLLLKYSVLSMLKVTLASVFVSNSEVSPEKIPLPV